MSKLESLGRSEHFRVLGSQVVPLKNGTTNRVNRGFIFQIKTNKKSYIQCLKTSTALIYSGQFQRFVGKMSYGLAPQAGSKTHRS